MPEWLSPELVLSLLTVAGFVAGIFLRGPAAKVAEVVVDLLKTAVLRLWPGRKPAALTPGEQIAEEHPVIAEPDPGTPAGALKATMDARVADRLASGIGASLRRGKPTPGYVPPPVDPIKADLRQAMRQPLSDPARQEMRRIVLKAAYELTEGKCEECDQGRLNERELVRQQLAGVARMLEQE